MKGCGEAKPPPRDMIGVHTRPPYKRGSGRVRDKTARVLSAVVSGWVLLWTSIPTLAAPCIPNTNSLVVEPGSGPSLLTVFDCEGGDFVVSWSGEVSVPGTIFIGDGTTVTINGDDTASTASGNGGLVAGGASPTSSNSGGGGDTQLEELSSDLQVSLPGDFLAAAVGGGGNSSAPIFQVVGGQIFLNALAVRDGNVSAGDGSGIHATNSNVTIVGCLFEDNFASGQGGAVFANQSTLTVTNSTFRNNSAGFETIAGEKDPEGSGGGIAAVDESAVLLDGCLFDTCYAGKKGGGLLQEDGQMSIANSLFFKNRAGSDNVEGEEPIGEGGGMSLSGCSHSDGSTCMINDTTFFGNTVAKKGGAIMTSSGDYRVELHRCVVSNNTAGFETTEEDGYLLDDPQGEGGAIVVGEQVTMLLADCVCEHNWAAKKGGVLNLAGGDAEENTTGGSVILQGSRFTSNRGVLNNAGVATMNKLTSATVLGDGNVFEYNTCAQGGAVFGADYDSSITVEGGRFYGNAADVLNTNDEVWAKGEQSGGVFWVKGELKILGGTYTNNEAKQGGVFQAAEESTVTIEGGTFEGNTAENGGVVYVISDGALEVAGGVFQGNSAGTGGGAFFVEGNADIQISGGNFSNNEADFGGFLYKEGEGITTCAGTTVLLHRGVDGGAIYAVDGATLDWMCDLKNNTALVGPAIYARENSNVTLRELELSDNFVTRGSAIFIDNSTLSTFKVAVADASRNEGLSAVQADELSTYVAEGTSFVGFVGETVIYSEGKLYLDECDFSGSSATVLVYAGQGDHTVIRNTMLGEMNYETEAAAASAALRLPSSDNFTNAGATCASSPPPCSEGSWCLDGDLGVYCQRYSLVFSSEEVCADGGVDALTLNITKRPERTFYPNLLEGELQLSLAGTKGADADSGSCDGAGGRVAWSVSYRPSPGSAQDEDDWTVFPSTGLLLPGESVTVRIVSGPSESINGVSTVNFGANDIASLSSAASSSSTSGTDDEDGSESKDSEVTLEAVEFYFCPAGNVWNSTMSGADVDPADACSLCVDSIQEAVEGVNCSSPGATTRSLPIKAGFWRADTETVTVRKCFNEDASKGGTSISNAQEYCNEGYTGPQCAVCEPGFGRGVADACHACTKSFQGGMYFLLAVLILLTVGLVSLLAVYLVGGKGAVSSKMATTRKSVESLHRRGSGLFTRSVDKKARTGFRDDLEESSFTVSRTGGTAVTTSSSSRAESMAAARKSASGKSGDGAVGAGEGGGEKGASVGSGRLGAFLSAIPLGKLKIVIVVWQISSAFAEITKVPFPPIYDKFLSVIGIFSFDLGWFLTAGCIATGISFYDKLLIVTIGPLVPLCFLGITFFAGSRPARRSPEIPELSRTASTRGSPDASAAGGTSRGNSARDEEGGEERTSSLFFLRPSVRRVLRAGPGNHSTPDQEHLWGLFARHTTIMLIFLYLVYTQISTVVFQTFACEELTEIGRRYLRADLRIDCDTPQHMAYMVYAGIMICVYPLGIPAVFLYFLVRQRSRINPPTDKALKDLRGGQHVVNQKITEREKDQSISPTSFLWSAYYPKCYYYEAFECIRRLLLTGLLVFLVPDTPGQVAISCIFAIFSLMTFELLRPHINPLDRQLYRTGCLVILFTNFLALVIKAGVASKDSSGSAAYSVALIIVNVLFFLSIWWNAWATAKATFSRRHAQDIMLGVDLVDESTIDKLLGPAKGTREPNTATAAGDAKIEDQEERPLWEIAPDSRIAPAFGGSTGDASRPPPSAEAAPAKGSSSLGENVRSALSKMAPTSTSHEVSASDMPVPRVAFGRLLSTAGRLVPESPTAEQATVPSPLAGPRGEAAARDDSSAAETSLSRA